jgi:serine/threonine-protein phosphatase 2B catalytic subunit
VKKALGSKADLLRKKVRAMSKMFKMLKTIREERENLTKLWGANGLIPRGLILDGAEAIHDAVEQFQKARLSDLKNEAMPQFPDSSTG